MKKLALIMVVLLSVTTVFNAEAGKKKKANKDTEQYRYDIEYAQTGANGVLVVKVWTYSKSAKVALEQCKKNAVHGVVFKGFTGETGTISQRALITDASVISEKKDFFDAFFADGGPYMKYVSAVGTGNREVRKIIREYKVGVTVTVDKDQLRKDLEAAGVVRGLNSGF